MSKRPYKKIESINILFTCIGRRVSLLNSFKSAAKQLKLKPCIIGLDGDRLSPALQLCDKQFLVKPVTHKSYIRELLDIVKKEKAHLVIPTVDLDLKVLTKNKGKFKKLGCHVLISSENVIDICQDKRKTYRFLHKNGFDTPATVTLHTALAAKKPKYPYFLKPWDGFASRGTAVVKNRRQLQVFGGNIPNCIVQEFVRGDEYTCDVYVDFDMKVKCVVPRKRIEVRSGEVSKSQVVKNERIILETKRLVETLGAGPGVVTLQLIANNNNIKFIEINPRFGGGAPLSIKAGANFPKWILHHFAGIEKDIRYNGFKDRLIMLRYDGEIWVS